MIANSGHDERGKYRGGKAGDQGGEFQVISWYSRPWTCVLRHPDQRIAKDIACCARVAQSAQWKSSDQYRSVSQDAYNLISIDTVNTLIKIVRGGGADIDNHMRTRKGITFNYSTGEIVGQVL